MAGAAFCPACGSPVTPTVTGAPVATPKAVPRPAGVAADFEAQRRRNRLMVVGAGAAALVAAFFGARAFGLLRLGASSPKPALQVRAEGPGASLQLPARVAPPNLQVGASRKQMPADVEAWLKHLEKCEKEKGEISSNQIAQAMVLTQKMQALGAGIGMLNDSGQLDPGSDDNKEPGAYAKDKVLDFRPPWDRLVAFFNSVPPPEECKPLASDFNRALGEVPGTMGDLANLFNSASSNPTEALKQANGMKNGSAADIDRYFGSADVKLGAICSKYDAPKWFEIKSDVGGSPLSMFGNVGGASGSGLPGMGQ